MFHIARMAGEIKIQNVGFSVLEFPLDIFNGFVSKNVLIQFSTHYKIQVL